MGISREQLEKTHRITGLEIRNSSISDVLNLINDYKVFAEFWVEYSKIPGNLLPLFYREIILVLLSDYSLI